jgi:hypothetical protein
MFFILSHNGREGTSFLLAWRSILDLHHQLECFRVSGVSHMHMISWELSLESVENIPGVVFHTTRKGPDKLVVQIVTEFVQKWHNILNDRDLQLKSKFLFIINAKRDSSLPFDLRRFAIALFWLPAVTLSWKRLPSFLRWSDIGQFVTCDDPHFAMATTRRRPAVNCV